MRRTHGLVSLGLVALSLALGFGAVLADSVPAAVVYALIVVGGSGAILARFCAACPDQANCAHVLPGLAARSLGLARSGPVNNADVRLTAAAVIVIVAYPQPWLLADPGLTAAFWAPLVIASAQIAVKLCPSCGNAACPMRARCRKSSIEP